MSSKRETEKLSALERKLLDEAQHAFPVCSRPYAELGGRVGCGEQEAYKAIQDLRQRGIIRRIGGIFDSAALGCATELVAMKVPAERIEKVAQTVNEYTGVTHNYEREGDYNLWFTITQETRSDLDRVVGDIKNRTEVGQMLRLPATRRFKTSVILPLEQ